MATDVNGKFTFHPDFLENNTKLVEVFLDGLKIYDYGIEVNENIENNQVEFYGYGKHRISPILDDIEALGYLEFDTQETRDAFVNAITKFYTHTGINPIMFTVSDFALQNEWLQHGIGVVGIHEGKIAMRGIYTDKEIILDNIQYDIREHYMEKSNLTNLASEMGITDPFTLEMALRVIENTRYGVIAVETAERVLQESLEHSDK